MPELKPCNICGSTKTQNETAKTKLLNLRAPTQIVRCVECGFLYLNPRFTIKELAEMYAEDEDYSMESTLKRASRMEFYHAKWARLEEYAPTRGRVLGIGCLDGGYAFKAGQDRGWQVSGVEFQDRLAEHCRTNLNLDVARSEAWDISRFDGRTFDAAFCIHLEHVPDPRQTLRQCHNMLTPNGFVFLELPNQFYSLVDRMKLGIIRVAGENSYQWFHRPVNFAYHMYHFTAKTIGTLLETEGFRVVKVRTYLPNHPLYHGGWSRRWLQEPLNAFGSLFGLGPCLEVIACKNGKGSAQTRAM